MTTQSLRNQKNHNYFKTVDDLELKIDEWMNKLRVAQGKLAKRNTAETLAEDEPIIEEVLDIIKEAAEETQIITTVEEEIEDNPVNFLSHQKYDEEEKDLFIQWAEEDQYGKLYELIGEEALKPEIENIVKELLEEYDEVVSKGSHDIGNCTLVEHAIRLIDDRPTTCRNKVRTPMQHEWIAEQVEIMQKNRVIEPSRSPYSANVVIVGKKDGEGLGMDRMCINFSALNRKTLVDKYPIPNIKEYLTMFQGAKYFTIIDLASAYWQIKLRRQDREKTAFITAQGLYQFIVMPFGLNNAPATFQRLMNDVLREYLRKFCLVYLDDIIIYSKTLKEHKDHVRKVLQKLAEANLKLKPSKCEWFKEELTFVGHVINREGVKPWEGNIKKILAAKVPETVTEVRRFLGMCQYYRQFIKDFSKIARPLFDLTKKDNDFDWREAQQQAYETLKTKLTSAPLLVHPNYEKTFKLYCDASNIGLGAVLCQEDENGKDRVIAYEARTLNIAERNYPTTEKECLTVVWATKAFKHYVGGWKKFKVFTDHAALKTLLTHEDPSPRRARWMEYLARYNFEIDHRPGSKMQHADYMSYIEKLSNEEYLSQNRTNATFVLNILYNDEEIYMSQRNSTAKVMANLLQTPGGKVDIGETSIQAAIRETFEETGIKCDPEYWGVDEEFNCDIYAYRIGEKETPKWMEPGKNGPWQHYTWEEYQILAKGEETTPSHTTHWERIMEFVNTKIAEPVQILNRNLQNEDMEIFTTEEELEERWNQEYREKGRIIPPQNMMIRQSGDELTNQPWWDPEIGTSRIIGTNHVYHND